MEGILWVLQSKATDIVLVASHESTVMAIGGICQMVQETKWQAGTQGQDFHSCAVSPSSSATTPTSPRDCPLVHSSIHFVSIYRIMVLCFECGAARNKIKKKIAPFPSTASCPFSGQCRGKDPCVWVPAGPSSSNTACGNICKSSGHSFLICKMEIIIVPAERHFMRIKWTSKDLNDGWYPGNLPQVLAVESKLSFRKVELYISS